MLIIINRPRLLYHMRSQPFIHFAECLKKEKLYDETIKEVLVTDIESGKYSEQINEEYNEVLQRQ